MAINNNLLIAAPMLQDSFIDKTTGLPMYGGTVTCYQDMSRTTLKNWYYQIQSGGTYEYIPLPNPLTLSAAGTICDINGVDTIPFYYPFDENDEDVKQAYYITIVNQTQTNQITRANFPYNVTEEAPTVNNASEENYVINNVFWRNIVSPPGAATTLGTGAIVNPSTPVVVAPSQHDGFQYPDIQFFKSNTSATDTVLFNRFLETNTPILTGDITPEFYLSHVCSVTGSSETYKFYLFPISLHLLTLSAQNNEYSITVQAQSVSGASTMTLALVQDPGTSASLVISGLETFTLTPSWVKYTSTNFLPGNAGIVTSQAGNDAVYLQIGLPINAAFSINIAKPSFYLNPLPPTNDFSTYDQVDSIINTPRTGDIRTSLNTWYNWGWVPMNDGTISLTNTNATPNNTRANIDCWPLFNLIWNLAKAYDTGSNFNAIAQMYTNNVSPTATNYGASAYADWIANNQLALTKSLGRAFAGTVPLSALAGINFWIKPVTITSSAGNALCTVTSTTNIFTGQPIAFTYTVAPTNIVSTAIYYATVITGTTFLIATTYANALAGTPVVAFGASGGTNVNVNLDLTGMSTGQYMHTQLVSELATHNHTPTGSSNNFLGNGTGGGSYSGSGNPIIGMNTTANNGLSAPFNIMQPTTFYNVYIKL